MDTITLSSCFISPAVSVEQFIPKHFFLYLAAGALTAYDGRREYLLQAGEYSIAKRNHLAKYTKHPENGEFKKIVIFFEQDFLKEFNETHKFVKTGPRTADAVVPLPQSALIQHFMQSLTPYFNENGTIDEQFLHVKRSELLLILLKENPALATVFFDFSDPEKVELERFMQQNFRFNISLDRLAYLTGRSLSTFKRDFEKVFQTTPSHWLVQRRLEEAYRLIEQENQKPSDIYLDLGFENFSHFSFAFKKLFGHSPTQLNQVKKAIR